MQNVTRRPSITILPPHPLNPCAQLISKHFGNSYHFHSGAACRYNLSLPEKNCWAVPNAFNMQEWNILATRKFQRVYAYPKQQITEKGYSFYVGLCLRCFRLSVCFQLLTSKVAELATPGPDLHPKKHWWIFWYRQPSIYGKHVGSFSDQHKP